MLRNLELTHSSTLISVAAVIDHRNNVIILIEVGVLILFLVA
jgi:hypothetical protein